MVIFGVPIIRGGGSFFSSNFHISANNNITCIILQDFLLAEKGWDGRLGRGE